MPFYQDWVIENVKKRLDKQYIEGRPAAPTFTGSNTAEPENSDSSKRSIIDLQLLVAVLIATVTFAASFTIPGGYNNDGLDQGMAVLAGKFDTCFVSDRLRVRYAKAAPHSMYVAILVMVLAFACGTYVVLPGDTGLGIVPFVVSGCLVIGYMIGGFLDPEAPF
ncbi:uncharacterized protein J3R85_012489 [Psidium guajava]|nr:uncharacterized protein J3R85_012489 [Psidium guajava]